MCACTEGYMYGVCAVKMRVRHRGQQGSKVGAAIHYHVMGVASSPPAWNRPYVDAHDQKGSVIRCQLYIEMV